MFDKGFVVQYICVHRKVTVIMPPFVPRKHQFTPSEIKAFKPVYVMCALDKKMKNK